MTKLDIALDTTDTAKAKEAVKALFIELIGDNDRTHDSQGTNIYALAQNDLREYLRVMVEAL